MGGGSHSENIPKFPMHGMHQAKSIKNVYVGAILSITGAILYKLLYARPRREAYSVFYSYYDPIEAFQRMKEDGYLQSCPAAPKEDPNDKKKKK